MRIFFLLLVTCLERCTQYTPRPIHTAERSAHDSRIGWCRHVQIPILFLVCTYPNPPRLSLLKFTSNMLEGMQNITLSLSDREVAPMRQGKAFGNLHKFICINRSKAHVWRASQSWYDAFVDDPLINYARAVCFESFSLLLPRFMFS